MRTTDEVDSFTMILKLDNSVTTAIKTILMVMKVRMPQLFKYQRKFVVIKYGDNCNE